MNIDERIGVFEKLGRYLRAIDSDEFGKLAEKVGNENPWFTPSNIRLAIEGLLVYLQPDHLREWVLRYNLPETRSTRTVAVIMAGNIPLAGFHDFLSVLISGHTAMIKLSSKDRVLLPYLVRQLENFEPRFRERIIFAEQLKGFDAVIATGSDNSSRYFEYYFGRYPHIIRKNRASCAILSGNESREELQALGQDVFSYFGLGCRNVSKIYAPEGYDFSKLFENWTAYAETIHHHKYNNNYDYQKSILLVNREPFLDNGFVILQENSKLVSPISVVYYEYYSGEEDIREKISAWNEKIQCVVGNVKPATIPFGMAQYPRLTDYADQIDTLKFLEGLIGN